MDVRRFNTVIRKPEEIMNGRDRSSRTGFGAFNLCVRNPRAREERKRRRALISPPFIFIQIKAQLCLAFVSPKENLRKNKQL